ncbi:hypothetical protein C667_02953 [Thauera phenylacetica B4P]|uniref:Uncharacterized protein n=1 Tax=Thauera phenylacetica B4P TaxID=1234382 RepID=N7A2V4_9RHOO|nr:hypothetical protein [Thauera phenylacetica]ENO98629.1 hypothetical protein C667_02953 [Thauera phenylacetica B4P]
MNQEFNGAVGLAAGRDVIVLQVPGQLSEDECELVRAYRAAPDEGRQMLRQVARAMVEAHRR